MRWRYASRTGSCRLCSWLAAHTIHLCCMLGAMPPRPLMVPVTGLLPSSCVFEPLPLCVASPAPRKRSSSAAAIASVEHVHTSDHCSKPMCSSASLATASRMECGGSVTAALASGASCSRVASTLAGFDSFGNSARSSGFDLAAATAFGLKCFQELAAAYSNMRFRSTAAAARVTSSVAMLPGHCALR